LQGTAHRRPGTLSNTNGADIGGLYQYKLESIVLIAASGIRANSVLCSYNACSEPASAAAAKNNNSMYIFCHWYQLVQWTFYTAIAVSYLYFGQFLVHLHITLYTP
jgi:hypothetical protein